MAGRRAPRKRWPRVRLHRGRSPVPQDGTAQFAPWFPAGPGWFGPYCSVAVRFNAWQPGRAWGLWGWFFPAPSRIAFPALPDYDAEVRDQ